MSILPNPNPDPEVDFINLAKILWQRKMLVVKLTGIAIIAGILISLIIPAQYTATTTIVQEMTDPAITLNEARLSAISALASVAGVDISGLTKAKMSPQTYSTILSSLPFRRELMNMRLNLGGKDTSITLFNYLTKEGNDHPPVDNSNDLSGQNHDQASQGTLSPVHHMESSPISKLTPQEIKINNILNTRLSLQILDDTYITIRGTLPDATAAAQLTQNASQLLQHYLIEIQTEKAANNLQFIQERYNQSKGNFLKIQNDLKSDEPRLSTEYRLAEKLYSDLASKLEQSKIALNEQTPVFRIVNPVTVPLNQSYPNRAKTTLLFAFFGFGLAMALILGSGFFEETKTKWRKKS